MASYRERLERDLDRWVEAGLITQDQRAPILNSLPAAQRLDAATALAAVGAVLFGVAAIAFIAANWDAMSRLLRFALLMTAFCAASGAAAFAAHQKRPIATDLLLGVASLIFAAAIGLTGQIFDLTGEPRLAFTLAAAVALGLALAGRSISAAIAAIALAGLADFDGFMGQFGPAPDWWAHVPLLGLISAIGVALAWRWRSTALAHASALGLLISAIWFIAREAGVNASLFWLMASFVAAGAAGAARAARPGPDSVSANVLYGWFAFSVLVFFGLSGVNSLGNDNGFGLVHRVLLIAGSGGLVALGRFDRHAGVTAVGVLGLIIGVFLLLGDLGLDLMTASLVFLGLAAAALVAGLVVRQKPPSSHPPGTAP